MANGRAALAAAAVAAAVALTACEPLETSGRSGTTGTSDRSGSAGGSQRVEYETSTDRGPSRRSVVVRSGSVATVTSRGSGSVTCRIVVNGRTVARRSGSGSVTCSARVRR